MRDLLHVGTWAVGCALGIGFAFATAWLFYDLEPLSFILLLTLPLFVRESLVKKREKHKEQLDVCFKDALLILRNALEAGYSAEHGLVETVRGLEGLYGKNALITREFREMAGKVSAGITMEQAFNEFAGKTDSKHIKEFAGLFRILKRTGGNLNRVIRQTVAGLTDTIALKRDLNVVIAAKRGEFRIMCAIPYGILLYLRLLAPDMVTPLYHDVFGMVFMSCIFLCCILCFVLGRLIISRTLQV